MEYTYQEFGEFIRNMRNAANMSSSELGELLDVHYTTILRWEKGKNLTQVDLLKLEHDIRNVVKYAIKQNRKKQKLAS
jgi:transcriptional regulator with XRE-family HTH domain